MPLFTSSGLSDLAECLADEYADRFDAAPVAAGARFDDDVLTFSFTQGLGREERVLRNELRMEELRDRRERFLEPAGAHLIGSVETFAHARVAFHIGLFDPGATATMILFGFEQPLAGNEASQRSELLSWSARVCEQARKLREEQVSAREAHIRICAEFRAERAKLAERFRDRD
jgi:hypothetical protein